MVSPNVLVDIQRIIAQRNAYDGERSPYQYMAVPLALYFCLNVINIPLQKIED